MKAQLLLILASVLLGGCSTPREVQDGTESPQTRLEGCESGIPSIREALTCLTSGKGPNKSFREMDASVGVHVAREMANAYSHKYIASSTESSRRGRELERLEIENKPYRLSSVDSIAGYRIPFSIQTRIWGYSFDSITVGVAERRKLSDGRTLDSFFSTKDKGWVDEVIYWLVLYAKCQPEVESASARQAFRNKEWALFVDGWSIGGSTVAKSPPSPCFDWSEVDDARWAPISDDAIKYVLYLRCAELADGSRVMNGEEALFWSVVFTVRFKSASGARELKQYREWHAENPNSVFWSKAMPLIAKFGAER